MSDQHQHGDFQKLLSGAPKASTTDQVTVVGLLARLEDETKFMLTMSDGQSVTLEVSAVKSAKALAGAIGQSLVQLELDARGLPEALRNVSVHPKWPPYDPTLPRWDHQPPPKVKYDEQLTAQQVTPDAFSTHTAFQLDQTLAYFDATPFYFDHGTIAYIDNGPVKVVGDPLGGYTIQETIGYGGYGGDPAWAVAPFVAAMPHQASPATIAALTQGMPGPYGNLASKPPITDRPKRPWQDGTYPGHPWDI